ncbi:hypothetical protein [Microbulbifer zhoushanensis]|uniref:hypothetical protein n=1 Tax=Microbulbifer zhoushanensis TaxID=2904254 RepID=UPI001F17683B|nr:hypothetical protein [Microbulbifer zhoushanensis]
MKKALPYLVTSLVLSAPALAQQPEAAGKEMKETKIPAEAQARMDEKRAMAEEKQMMAEQKRLQAKEKAAVSEEKRLTAEEKKAMAEHKRMMAEKKADMAHEGHMEDAKDNKGMAKQAAKKAEQERKELGKGSEQGQAAREENSKKWWQFWK